MHVVTGGAYNGKAAWVREYYQLEQRKRYHWFNAYEDDTWPTDMQSLNDYVVFEGVEQWVFHWINKQDLDEARKYGRRMIEQWLDWEQKNTDHKLIIIGTDISKGIVPMDASMRKWRDMTGWFYQDLVERSERVDLIWYGIAKQLK